MQLNYKNPINYLQLIKDATAKRNESFGKVSNFSEYNAAEQQKRREKQVETINQKYMDDMNSIEGRIRESLSNLDRNIYKVKYPLYSADNDILNERHKALGGQEVQSGMMFALNYKFGNYPSEAIMDTYFNAGRYDFVFSALDLFLNVVPTTLEASSEKNDLIKIVNKYYKALGITDKLLEKAELEYVLGEQKIEYAIVFNSNYKIQYGVTDMRLNQQLTQIRKELA